MAITQLTGKQIKDQSIDLSTDVTGVLPTVNGGTPQYILLQDQRPSGTNGSSLTADAWRKLDLNTISQDDTSSVAVSSNNFTLPAGTYEINARCPIAINDANESHHGKMRLYNESDNNVVLYGQSAVYSAASSNFSLSGKFTISLRKSFSLYVYLDYASGIYAAGVPSAPEIYTEVELRKVS